MGRVLRLICRVTAAVIALVIVPTLVNIQTGGTAPGFLARHAGWLWPAVGVFVAVFVVLEAWGPVRAVFGPMNVRRPDDPRNLPNALHQVQRYVGQRLSGSLVELVRIELTLEERPEAVLAPTNLVQRVREGQTVVPLGTPIFDLFDSMQRSILILGAPGAGKTTLLLDLAASLAHVPQAQVVPVVVDLAEWPGPAPSTRVLVGPRPDGEEQPDFVDWLLTVVERRYRIPPSIGRAWLTDGRLALLLDGLDEVDVKRRDQCVQEINDLQDGYHYPPLAICCREADYAELTVRLRLQGAVEIRPLTRDQVRGYLATAGSTGLGATGAVLDADPDLRGLLTSPFWLNVLALTYAGRPVDAPATGSDVIERRRQVLDTYVVEVLRRRGAARAGRPIEETLYALKILATASIRRRTGVTVQKPATNFDWADVLPERAAWLAGARLQPAAVLSFAAASVFVLGRHLGIVAALAAGIVLAGSLLYRVDGFQFAHPPGVPKVRAAVATVAAVVGGAALGVSTGTVGTALASVAMVLPWLTAAVLVILVPAVLVPERTARTVLMKTATAVVPRFRIDRTRRHPRLPDLRLRPGWVREPPEPKALEILLLRLALTTLAAGLVALLWMAGPSSTPRGLCAGAVVTFFAGLPVYLLRVSDRVGGYRAEQLTVGWPVTVVAVALLASAAAGAGLRPPSVGLILGVVWGLLVGTRLSFIGGFVFGPVLSGPLMRLVHAVTGDPWPWRRRFWQFAADRSILTKAEGEFRFIHVLVRDHLAACDPATLARSLRERSVRAGGTITTA